MLMVQNMYRPYILKVKVSVAPGEIYPEIFIEHRLVELKAFIYAIFVIKVLYSGKPWQTDIPFVFEDSSKCFKTKEPILLASINPEHDI